MVEVVVVGQKLRHLLEVVEVEDQVVEQVINPQDPEPPLLHLQEQEILLP